MRSTLATVMAIGLVFGLGGEAKAGAIADVSPGEMAGYSLLYAVNDNNFDFNDPYIVDNSGITPIDSFARVGYYVELGGQWVWASMDTFNTDPARVGVPRAGTNIVEAGTLVTNLNVETNHPNVTPGTGLDGIIEFWSSNYNANGGGLYGSDNGRYDWKDSGGSSGGGHGSFQVFARPTDTTGTTIFGITSNGGSGIGDQYGPGGGNSPDWTFGPGTGTYATRNLEIWVKAAVEIGENFVWDTDTGTWGAVTDPLHPGESHWFNPVGPAEFPDTVDDIADTALIEGGECIVVGDRAAFSVTINGLGLLTIDATGTLEILDRTVIDDDADILVAGTLTTKSIAKSIDGIASGGVTIADGGLLAADIATLNIVTVETGGTLQSGGGTIGLVNLTSGGTIGIGGTVDSVVKTGPAGDAIFANAADLVVSSFTDSGINGDLVKQGDGVLDMASLSLTAVGGNVKVSGGELKTYMNAGNPLGGAGLILDGGTFTTVGPDGELLAPGRLAYGWYNDTSNNTLLQTDDGTDNNATNGGLFALTPSDEATWPAQVQGKSMWTGEVWQGGNISDTYTQMWSGIFTAPETGTYEFYISGDDNEVLWIDVDQDHDFETSAGELISNNAPPEGWNTPHTETVDLVAGESYDFALIMNENGGGDFLNATMKTPSGGHARINPALQAEMWSAFGPAHMAIDMSATAVTLSESSTLNAETSQTAVFGSLRYAESGKTLTTDGAVGGILFTETTFDHADARITPNTNTRLGTLAGDVGATLTVAGGSGALVFDGENSTMGALSLELIDGTLGLTDGTVAAGVTFDRPIEASGNSTIIAGQYPGGQDGPKVVTLGGAHGVTLSSGLLTLGTKDDYTLKLGSALIDNGGDLSFAPGSNVDVGIGGGARNIIVSGSLGNVVGAENLTLSGGILVRPSVGNPVIDCTLDMGASTMTIGDDDVVDGEVTLSGLTGASTGLLTIARSVVNIPDLANLPNHTFSIGQNTPDELAVLQSQGVFARSMAGLTDSAWMKFTGHGGFAAKGGTLTVRLNELRNTMTGKPADYPVLWQASSTGGGLGGFALQFGSPTADAAVDLATSLNLGDVVEARTFNLQVVDNADVTTDKLVISGKIIGTNNHADAMLRINQYTGGNFNPQLNGNWRTTKNPLIELTGANTFAYELVIDQGTVFAIEGQGLPTNAQLHFDANNWESEAVFMSNGTLNRTIGDGAGEVKFDNNGGGFAARGGTFTVTLEGAGTVLDWNDGSGGTGFNGGKALQLGSRYADNVVTFTNPISHTNTGQDRRIALFDNPDSASDRVVMEGDVSIGRDLYIQYRGNDMRSGAARIDFGTPADPKTITVGRDLRIYEGVEFNYYTDMATVVRELNVIGNSVANIHGDVTLTGRAWASGDSGSVINIDGFLNTGTAAVGAYNGSTVNVGLDPLKGQDLTMGNVLEVHQGSQVNVAGNFTNGNRIYVEHSGSRIDVGGNYVGKELQMYNQDVEMNVAGDALFNGRMAIGNGNTNTYAPAGVVGESGPYLNVAGVLTKTDMGQDFELHWGAEVKAMTPGSSIQARHFLVRNLAEAFINGPVTHNGRFDAIDNGGGIVTIMGTYTKTDIGQRFLCNNGSIVTLQDGTAEASEMQIRQGSQADLGTVDFTLRDRIYMNEAGSYGDIGGSLTIDHATNANAIEMYNGTLNVGGAVRAFRANVQGGMFQPNSTVVLVDELYLTNGGTISAGDGVASVAVDATRLRFDGAGASYRWELGASGAAAGAGVGYDTIALGLGTKLEMNADAALMYTVQLASDGFGQALPADVFTILSYDLGTVDPLTNFDVARFEVALAPDAPSWWDASGVVVTHNDVAGSLELTGLFAPGAAMSNVAGGSWNAPVSWAPMEVPSATRVGVVRNGHAIAVGSTGNSTLYVGIEDGGALQVDAGGALGDTVAIPRIDVAADAGNGGGSLSVVSGGTLIADIVNSAGSTSLASSTGTIGVLNANAGSVTANGASIGVLKVRSGVAAGAVDLSITDRLVVSGAPQISVVPGGSFKVDGADLANQAVQRTLTLTGDEITIGAAAPESFQSMFTFESKIGSTVEDQIASSTHEGVLVGGADITTGGQGYGGGEALQLSADGDYMDITDPTAFDFSQAYTWAAAIKTTDGSGAVLSRNPDGTAWNQGSQALFVRGNNAQFDAGWVGNPNTGTAVQDDVWHQLVVTFDPVGDDFKIYVDGVMKYPGPFDANRYDEATTNHNGGFANTSFTVGRADFSGGLNNLDTLIGLIDDVAVFNEALTGDNLTQLLNDGATSFLGGPVEMATTNITMAASSTLNLGSNESGHFGQLDLGVGNTLTIVANAPVPTTLESVVGTGAIDAVGDVTVISLSPGSSIGTVDVEGNLNLAAGSSFNAELIGTQADSVTTGGLLRIDPNASLNLVVNGGGNEFKAGTVLLVDAAGGIDGQFNNVTNIKGYVDPGTNGLTYAGGIVTLKLNLNLNPGDANLDGATDVADRIIWNNNNFTEGTAWRTGDFNNDGATDVADRIIWNNHNFTEATAGPIAAAAADSDGPAPEFIYDAETGIMRVVSNGHYLVAIIVPGPGETTPEGQSPRDTLLLPSSKLPDFVMNDRVGPNVWTGADYFRGKFQSFDSVNNGLNGEFDVAQWAPGLSENDFGMVEWGSVPTPGQSGVSGFSPVTVVPEPATMALLGLGGLVALARRRRRK